MAVNDRELQALLSLLETEGGLSVTVLLGQMRQFPDVRLRRLASMVQPHSPAETYISLVLAERDAPQLQAALARWRDVGGALEDGVLQIVRFGDPLFDTGVVRQQLDELAASGAPGLPADRWERGRYLAHLLGEVHGFHGNVDEYYDPQNGFLQRVLQRRTGLPITLCVLYILVGARLGIPVSGLALPHHFVVSVDCGGQTRYFDPFDRGAALTPEDVARIVSDAGECFEPDLLRPATSRQIIRRMLANLVNAYEMREERARAALARRYFTVLEESEIS